MHARRILATDQDGGDQGLHGGALGGGVGLFVGAVVRDAEAVVDGVVLDDLVGVVQDELLVVLVVRDLPQLGQVAHEDALELRQVARAVVRLAVVARHAARRLALGNVRVGNLGGRADVLRVERGVRELDQAAEDGTLVVGLREKNKMSVRAIEMIRCAWGELCKGSFFLCENGGWRECNYLPSRRRWSACRC
jgi:hypothetical protein